MTLSDELLRSKFALALRGMQPFIWCLVIASFIESVNAQDNVGDESTIRYPAEYFVDLFRQWLGGVNAEAF